MTTSAIRRQMKNIVNNYSEAEIKVREATSNDPWGPSSSLMTEIADLTYNVVAFSEIMSMIWKRLNDHGKNWRHVYKALTLLDYMIKTGSERVAQQCKENIFAIQTLKDFQYIDRDGKDQGINVREKSKQLVTLLKDDERLKSERTQALKTKERMAQVATGVGSNNQISFGRGSSQPNLSTSYSEHEYGKSGGSPASYHGSTSPRASSELEQARPQTSGEEELQLQLALAMSREAAEQLSVQNVTRAQRNAIKALKTNRNIVIKPADKGGAIVIQNRMDYCKEAYRQLDNQEHYRRLPANPTKEHTHQLNKLIKTFDPDLQNILRTLIPRTPRVGDFYCLPKIHKANTPGRPIVSGNGTLCENLSGYIEGILKPIVLGTPSFCRDTTDFLQKLSTHGPVEPGTLLTTMDVSALYTSIPHDDGIAATASILNTNNSQSPDAILQLIRFILDHNVFTFNNQFFTQTHGTAMGTKFAPQYANIFMHKFEQDFFTAQDLQPTLYTASPRTISQCSTFPASTLTTSKRPSPMDRPCEYTGSAQTRRNAMDTYRR
ncbi:uncharacterized protein epn2 isoform X2 [Heptranchias perlo]|uniref:uncharacterized protein epn2 isoform X2 n=1 Tax=Heptranchias perlo TaxID=212740 RepID=UPI00355A9058